MTRSHWGRGDKGKATKLHSLLVRARGACENCGETDYAKLQCAHIISRRYAHTRTMLANAFCLCAKCHMYYTGQPVEFARFTLDKIGQTEYAELLAESQLTTKVDWEQEARRLQTLWDRKPPSTQVAGSLPDFSQDSF